MSDNVIEPRDWVWKLVERDVDKYWRGEQREMCAANVGQAIAWGLYDEVDDIKRCWAEAQQVKARREQKEGA